MFQLWEAESANLVGSYETEDEALSVIRKAIEKHGPESVESILLLREGSRGRLAKIAEGVALVDRALARSSPVA
ncbi:MAG: hypothetical protein U0893_10000 [Chloroflexota bacterium]